MRKLIAVFAYLILTGKLWACACGCGVFEVGTRSMLPTHPGSMLSIEYDHQNQNRNWSGTSPSSADANDDKKIQNNFITLSYQHLFNRRWGFSVELPYTQRFFKTTDEEGNVQGFDHSAVGDIRLQGIYTGFSDTMSTGLTFGIKLPSGDYTYPNFDADTEIGSGSTDLLLGAFHVHEIPTSNWNLYTSGQWDQPLIHEDGYRPGAEVNAVVGTYYDHWKISAVKCAPLIQVIGSARWRDSGTQALSEDTGFERVLLAPGIEFDVAQFRIYGDVGFPMYQRVNGNQLVASQYFKVNLSYQL